MVPPFKRFTVCSLSPYPFIHSKENRASNGSTMLELLNGNIDSKNNRVFKYQGKSLMAFYTYFFLSLGTDSFYFHIATVYLL